MRSIEKIWPIACRVGIGFLLLFAGWQKIFNGTLFLRSIEEYKLPLTMGVQKMIVIIVPAMELVCGTMLIIGLWLETAVPLVTYMFACFVIVTAQSVIRGLDVNCGCFGGGQSVNPRIAFLRASLLLILILILWKAQRNVCVNSKRAAVVRQD